MKNNKYFIITLLLILFSALGYKAYKVYENSKEKITKEVVTIYIKNNEIKDGIIEVVDEFNENHEDIYVRLRLTNDDYDNIVHTKLANAYDIDIFEYNGRTLLDKGFIKPLNSINIDLSEVNDNSFLYVNDEVYGLKYGMAMEKFMYNLDAFKEANIDFKEPETLDELITLLTEVKNKTGKVPLSLSLDNIHDIFSIVGGMSTSENTTYSTFWNYKTGEYDYEGLTKVIEKLNFMYENDLINKDFESKSYEELFEEFKNVDTFTIPVNYFKKYSVMDRFEGMNLEYSNVPKVSKSDKDYYYTYSRTLVLANNDRNLDENDEEAVLKNNKHNEAVKYVFEWLMSNDTTKKLAEGDYNFSSFNSYVKKDEYINLNDNKGYLQNPKDPTEILAGNSNIVKEYIVKMIKGEIEISEGISNLKIEYNKFINDNSRNKDIDLSKYKE